jgi:hypothetical protein
MQNDSRTDQFAETEPEPTAFEREVAGTSVRNARWKRIASQKE